MKSQHQEHGTLQKGASVSLDELIQVARQIKTRNVALQLRTSERPWSIGETMLGFTTDVGDLARLVMEAEKLRPESDDLHERIEHELADCLWSVLTLADELGVDLEEAFHKLARTISTRAS